MLTHFSLFSGIGGLDLAAEWAGFTTVGQCEYADYPTKVLEKHWPEVSRWRDIRSVTAASFREKTGFTTVDVISGGFPCQPFSVAGNQKGKEDDRYLWPEMLRIARELTPDWVVGENVPGILSIAADDICKDLEREGYEVGVFNFEAAAVGARHRRERVFFVARNTNSKHEYNREIGEIQDRKNTESTGICANVSDTNKIRCNMRGFEGEGVQRGNQTLNEADSSCEDVADTYGTGCKEFHSSNKSERERYNTGCIVEDLLHNSDSRGCSRQQWWEYAVKPSDGCWWAVEPELGRVAHGIPARVDRLKCLGNAVVPHQAYPVFRAIRTYIWATKNI